MSFKNQNKRALVAIAHCDDAVLWMGGAIHRLRDWEWCILSMCNGNNDQKIQSFNESCQMLEVEKYQALNFRDYQNEGVFSHNDKEEMKSELIKFADETYDYFFSHSLKGYEYGPHDNHKEVGVIASEITKERSWQLIQFCYYPIYGAPGTATVAYKEKADYYYQLNYEDLRFKLKLIDCFPYEMESLRSLGFPCPNPEAYEGNSLPPPFIKKQ